MCLPLCPQPGRRSGGKGISDIFLITMTTEESICRGMFLTGFGKYICIGECEPSHMFASENCESRLTSTYAMTLSFHPWNTHLMLACEEKTILKKEKDG